MLCYDISDVSACYFNNIRQSMSHVSLRCMLVILMSVMLLLCNVVCMDLLYCVQTTSRVILIHYLGDIIVHVYIYRLMACKSITLNISWACYVVCRLPAV